MSSSIPLARIAGLVTNRSSPTSWISSPRVSVSCRQPSQSPSARPSSIETIGNRSHRPSSQLHHALRVERLALAGQVVAAVLEELAGGDVQAQDDVLAQLVAGRLDALLDEGQRLLGVDVGGEAALVADGGVVAGVLEQLLERVEHLGAGAQGLAEALGPHRQDHELLDVERVVGMGAAIDDVHQRRRQHARVDAAQIAIERQAGADGGGPGGGEAHGQDGVGAETLLVLGAVELDHRGVERGLVERVEAGDRVGDLAVDGVDRAGHALAEIAALVAVAQLDGLARAGRGARGHGRPAEGAALQDDVGLDGRVAAAVQDLAAADRDDLELAHDAFLPKVAGR